MFLAIYGAVLGTTHSPAQALSSAVKLPILFLAMLLVCVPTLYFFNVLFGSDQGIGQNVALILTAIVVTAVPSPQTPAGRPTKTGNRYPVIGLPHTDY